MLLRLAAGAPQGLIGVKTGRDNALVQALLRCLPLAAALTAAAPAGAQQHDPPNGIFLVAKPGLPDPNLRQTVVLVTKTRDFSTLRSAGAQNERNVSENVAQ